MDANRTFGHLRPPTAEQIKKYAARYHMTLSDEHAAGFVSVMSAIMMDIDKIDELPEPPAPRPSRPEIRADRPRQKKTPITRSSASAPSVRGADEGPLVGVRAAIKDCIAVAGVPMTNGSRMLPVMTPDEDAVVVERLLAAGATIVSKTNMEDLAMGLDDLCAAEPRFRF